MPARIFSQALASFQYGSIVEMSNDKNILVIRNDKLGDFMLAWPALSLLKKQYPESKVTVLIPSYTKPMAEICPWIDDCIIDMQHKSVLSDAIFLKNKIKNKNFDTSISLFTETRTAVATFLSRIPLRLAPATKIAQIFSNRRLPQRRSSSSRPEHEYNTDLVRFFITLQGDTPVSLQQPPFLQFDATLTQNLRAQYITEHNINIESMLIIVHPGTGGSAINFSVKQYAELIKRIAKQIDAHFIITAGPGEDDTAQTLSSLILHTDHSVYFSSEGIVEFSHFIAISNLFISGSTGTLHIAGALDIPTAAFYPARKSATALRWQTLNQASRRLAFSPEKYTGDNDMDTIDPVACAQQIVDLLKRLYATTGNV
jgi:ADP-heptose:LPS heptosyltransferase